MIRTHNARRAGFTLVELLVSVSIFIGLAGLVLLLYPSARDQDRVRYAVSDIGAHLRMAQSMAARDKAPRGVRFLVSTDLTNDDKTDPRWVTELQFVEQPPPLIPNRTPLKYPPSTYPTLGTAPNVIENLDPRVRFQYDVATNGSITNRRCFIENLKSEEADLVQPGCTIVMPTFNSWNKISSQTSAVTKTAAQNGLFTVEVVLEVYPDAVMGGSTHATTHNFAVYLLPTPLVGEPTILLPKNICVDLNVSVPNRQDSTADFDVLFGPDGKLVGAPSGQLFLWVRDYTKTAPYTVNNGPPRTATLLTGTSLLDALRKGGEQHIISIRASGSHGNNEVTWPDSSGAYPPGQSAYWLAQQEIRQ